MSVTITSTKRWGDLTGNLRAIALSAPVGAQIEEVSRLITRGEFDPINLAGTPGGVVRYAIVPYLYDHEGIIRLDTLVYTVDCQTEREPYLLPG